LKLTFLQRIFIAVNLGLIAATYFEKTTLVKTITFTTFVCLCFINIFYQYKKSKSSTSSTPLSLSNILLISSYFCLSNLNIEATNKIDSIFWGLFTLEIAAQFFAVKKFKQPVQIEPVSIKIYTLLQIGLFAYLMLFSWQSAFWWILLLTGFVSNIDLLLIIYWLPFYKPEIKASTQALSVKKEYQKIYNT